MLSNFRAVLNKWYSKEYYKVKNGSFNFIRQVPVTEASNSRVNSEIPVLSSSS